MKGSRKMEALAHNNGCRDSEKGANEEDKYCTEEVIFAKLETVFSQHALAIALPVFFHEEAKSMFSKVLNSLPTDRRFLNYTDSSPLLYGHRLLHLLQVLII